MRSLIQVFTGLLLLVTVAHAQAAPPRLTGQGQAHKEAPAPQVNPPSVAATAEAPEPEPVATAPDTAAVDPPAGQSPASATKKSAWAAFWEKLRIQTNGKPQTQTTKQPAELVNTQQHHTSMPELLGQGDLHRFSAGQAESWQVQASSVMCIMRQAIPDYGVAEFRQGVGQPLVFALHVAHPPAGTGRAHLRSEAPRWQHYVASKDLGMLELGSGARALTASSEWSRRLLLELSEGMVPVMRYWDAADATDDMEIRLSAINFRRSLTQFHHCLGQLKRYDVEQIKRLVVNFNEDSTRLGARAAAQLDDALEILRNDPRIRFIEVEVYTRRSEMQRYDFRLATRRTQTVRDYFIKQGVAEDKLMIKIHTKSEDELKALGYRASDVLIALRYDKSDK